MRKSQIFALAAVLLLTDFCFSETIKGTDTSKKCDGDIGYDECGNRCIYFGGEYVNCCRLRKEFTNMTRDERIRYVDTVIKASTDYRYKRRYEKLLTMHQVYFDGKIHNETFFLPWHRWFLLEYENLLREIDCRVTVPYWDWSQVAHNLLSSDLWNPGRQGFGGKGTAPDYCVKNGPFREGKWSLIPSAGGGCLRRIFNNITFDHGQVIRLLVENKNASQFKNFSFFWEGFHDQTHCAINGTMCLRIAASAPEFFLHHGYIDKIWWNWQGQSDDHMFNEFFMTQEKLMPMTIYRSRDFNNLNHMPGGYCAEYVSHDNITKALKELTVEDLKTISPANASVPEMSKQTAKLFGVSNVELEEFNTFVREKLEEPTQKPTPYHGSAPTEKAQTSNAGDVFRNVNTIKKPQKLQKAEVDVTDNEEHEVSPYRIAFEKRRIQTIKKAQQDGPHLARDEISVERRSKDKLWGQEPDEQEKKSLFQKLQQKRWLRSKMKRIADAKVAEVLDQKKK